MNIRLINCTKYNTEDLLSLILVVLPPGEENSPVFSSPEVTVRLGKELHSRGSTLFIPSLKALRQERDPILLLAEADLPPALRDARRIEDIQWNLGQAVLLSMPWAQRGARVEDATPIPSVIRYDNKPTQTARLTMEQKVSLLNHHIKQNESLLLWEQRKIDRWCGAKEHRESVLERQRAKLKKLLGEE